MGLRIRAIREAGGLTQEQIVGPGLSWRTVQQLEAGKTDPRLSTVRRLAAALGVSVDRIVVDPGDAKSTGGGSSGGAPPRRRSRARR